MPEILLDQKNRERVRAAQSRGCTENTHTHSGTETHTHIHEKNGDFFLFTSPPHSRERRASCSVFFTQRMAEKNEFLKKTEMWRHLFNSYLFGSRNRDCSKGNKV